MAAGMKSNLRLTVWYKAVKGFTSRLRFSKKTFICPSCTELPPFLVFDGKQLGPQKRKVNHIHELGANEGDKIFGRASEKKDRLFLPVLSDRKRIIELLGNHITSNEFLQNGLVSPISGNLLVSLITRLLVNEGKSELPKAYNKFISACSKASSVSGFLQVSSPRSLEILRGFCVEAVNIRDIENWQYLKIVAEEMPPLWLMLVKILDYEKTSYLPLDVANIVEHLIRVREEIFTKCLVDNSGRIPWEDPLREHCTMFYPAFPMEFYPRRYLVAGETDPDYCTKEIPEHHDFCHGIFSAGCACKYATTYGFELMLNKETPHNVFRFFTCRKVKLTGENCVKAAFYDNACNLCEYCLNREPKKFQFLRFLVDGSHWVRLIFI